VESSLQFIWPKLSIHFSLFTCPLHALPILPTLIDLIIPIKVARGVQSWRFSQGNFIQPLFLLLFLLALQSLVHLSLFQNFPPLFSVCQFFFPPPPPPHGSTTSTGTGAPHYRIFTITLRRTTLGKTPLDEWSARRTDLYLSTLTRNRHPCPQRDSNPESQQTCSRRPTP